jgi:uncharacterized protein (TIGR02145 family)
MRFLTLFILTPMFLFAQSKTEIDKNKLKSQTENQTDLNHYKVGSQIWMINNLDVKVFRNGDSIKHARTENEWLECAKKQVPAWCYFNNNEVLGKRFGMLYNWYAVNDPRGLAPKGYKIPNEDDWNKLIQQFGGESVAAPKMRYGKLWGDSLLVTSRKGNFGALPSGWRKYTNEKTEFINNGAYWWSSSSQTPKISWTRYLVIKEKEVKSYCYDKGSGLSVRCLKVER